MNSTSPAKRSKSQYAKMREPYTLDQIYEGIKRDILHERSVYYSRVYEEGYNADVQLMGRIWLLRTASFIATDRRIWYRFCKDPVWKSGPEGDAPPDFDEALIWVQYWIAYDPNEADED